MPTLTHLIPGGTLVADCADMVQSQCRGMLAAVASLAGQGSGIADGVKVQFGWSVLTIRQEGSNFRVCEPDFDGDPFTQVRPDVTCTLAVLAMQVGVVRRVGVDPVEVRFDEKVVLRRGVLAEPHVFLNRGQPTEGDSGWFVGPVEGPEYDPDDLSQFEAIRVYELWRERRPLLSVLGLPPGHIAVFRGDTIESVMSPAGEDVWAKTAG